MSTPSSPEASARAMVEEACDAFEDVAVEMRSEGRHPVNALRSLLSIASVLRQKANALNALNGLAGGAEPPGEDSPPAAEGEPPIYLDTGYRCACGSILTTVDAPPNVEPALRLVRCYNKACKAYRRTRAVRATHVDVVAPGGA